MVVPRPRPIRRSRARPGSNVGLRELLDATIHETVGSRPSTRRPADRPFERFINGRLSLVVTLPGTVAATIRVSANRSTRLAPARIAYQPNRMPDDDPSQQNRRSHRNLRSHQTDLTGVIAGRTL